MRRRSKTFWIYFYSIFFLSTTIGCLADSTPLDNENKVEKLISKSGEEIENEIKAHKQVMEHLEKMKENVNQLTKAEQEMKENIDQLTEQVKNLDVAQIELDTKRSATLQSIDDIFNCIIFPM